MIQQSIDCEDLKQLVLSLSCRTKEEQKQLLADWARVYAMCPNALRKIVQTEQKRVNGKSPWAV